MTKFRDYSDKVRELGKSPDTRVCPQCLRQVGGFYLWTGFQFARHRDPATGKKCRRAREAVTGRLLSADAPPEATAQMTAMVRRREQIRLAQRKYSDQQAEQAKSAAVQEADSWLATVKARRAKQAPRAITPAATKPTEET